MGFRDFHCFNLAMLAKQVWRLFEDPDSLCARVLKAKYYPDGKLLQAKLKSGSSFTWQSILAGLECFKRGYIWRVGDDTQINIWEDRWIPGSHNLKVLTPRGNIVISTVDELINPIDGRWDEEMIRSLFWPVDVHRILQIPIYDGREDLIAWNQNRNGLFTVKSAYHCQWSHKFESRSNIVEAGASNSQTLWKKLWKLSSPGKIKNFAWRALHGCIPCHVILVNKHIINVVNCPVCQTEAEDIRRILFSCSRAREIWRLLGVWQYIERLLMIDISGSVLIQEIIRNGGEESDLKVGRAELIITGCWYIWWQRRQLVHGEEIENPSRSAMSITAVTSNYYVASKKGVVINQGWRKPSEGYMMINIDGAFDEIRGAEVRVLS
ncbi:hypothetical protein PVAP13_9NG588514 [Panicum virgatum]|uniref:Reverse transcriptase zinc-binding domain-containing protein n=1 Tax=Panicum virgatum TaxID=38727 RepID=A0A8T0N110_PANVG|nr:hypothetical protein PVAP13_9NG588514 [Panicum virgatum]